MTFIALTKGRYLEALAVDEHVVWCSDVVVGGVQGCNPDGSTSHWLPDRQWIGGLLLNEDGSLLCSGPGGIVWFNPATGRSGTLLDRIDGAPITGVNEMCPDGRGGLIFGTLDLAFIRGERTAPVALYHLDVQRSVTLLCDRLVFSNGIGISADGSMLYHNESFVGTFAYDVAPDGSLSHRRMLIEKQDCDGMALDTQGNLWLTGFGSGELLCLRPDGAVERRFPVPGGAATNVRFGGAGGRDLFVTTVPLSAGAEIAQGRLPSALDSVLYRVPSPIAGRITLRTRFRLE